MMTKTLLLAAGAAVLGACAGGPGGHGGAMPVTQMHPITVDQQAVALRVGIDASRRGLGRGDLAEIDRFVSAYRTRGYGPITVTAPVGGGADRDAQTVAADVRRALHAAGVPYEALQGASVTTGGGGDVIASFQSYVAIGPACGRESGAVARRLSNRRSADFGCADQANLAAMIADPRDLHQRAGGDGAGDGQLTRAILGREDAAPRVVTYEIERR